MAVMMAVPPVTMVVMMPAAVMHLFGRRHAVRRRAEPGRRERHRGGELRRRECDGGSSQSHQDEFVHVGPLGCGRGAAGHGAEPRVTG